MIYFFGPFPVSYVNIDEIWFPICYIAHTCAHGFSEIVSEISKVSELHFIIKNKRSTSVSNPYSQRYLIPKIRTLRPCYQLFMLRTVSARTRPVPLQQFARRAGSSKTLRPLSSAPGLGLLHPEIAQPDISRQLDADFHRLAFRLPQGAFLQGEAYVRINGLPPGSALLSLFPGFLV